MAIKSLISELEPLVLKCGRFYTSAQTPGATKMALGMSKNIMKNVML